jgi:hypothetical protein
MNSSLSASDQRRPPAAARWLRIAARVLSVLLLFLLLFDWIETGPGPFTRTVHHDDIREWWATALMVVAGVGVFIAWKWELVGGALATGSMALFAVIALPTASDGEVVAARLFATIIFGLPGVCFLLAALLSMSAGRPRGHASDPIGV